MSFQQHLPGAGEHRHGEAPREVLDACALRLADGRICASSPGRLHDGDGVDRVRQVCNHLTRLSAVAIERIESDQRTARVAFQHDLQEIENAAPVGEPEQLA